jgi:hypothetical protein
MAATLERITTRDANEKRARQRLSIVQLVEELGSLVSTSCRAKMRTLRREGYAVEDHPQLRT